MSLQICHKNDKLQYSIFEIFQVSQLEYGLQFRAPPQPIHQCIHFNAKQCIFDMKNHKVMFLCVCNRNVWDTLCCCFYYSSKIDQRRPDEMSATDRVFMVGKQKLVSVCWKKYYFGRQKKYIYHCCAKSCHSAATKKASPTRPLDTFPWNFWMFRVRFPPPPQPPCRSHRGSHKSSGKKLFFTLFGNEQFTFHLLLTIRW